MKARWQGIRAQLGAALMVAGVAGVMGVTAACGDTSDTGATGTGTSSGVVPGGPMMGSGTTDVTVAQNGTTVHIPVGGTVALVDFPSNWFPRSSDVQVLADPPVAPGPSACKDRAAATNPPGVPCTQVPLDYAGKTAGTAVLTAHRTQCGEARPCVAPESYDFRLTVVVG